MICLRLKICMKRVVNIFQVKFGLVEIVAIFSTIFKRSFNRQMFKLLPVGTSCLVSAQR